MDYGGNRTGKTGWPIKCIDALRSARYRCNTHEADV